MAYSTSLLCITIETLFFFSIVILDAVVYYMTFLRVGGFKPFHRGFFCNDHNIMKPYKTERLSFVGILTAGTVLSLSMIAVIELELYFKKLCENGSTSNEKRKTERAVPSCAIRMVHRMGVFGCGLAVMLLICQVVAMMTGRLRPHFLAVCRPNNTLYNCKDGYITADVCTGDPLLVKRARLSFPSIHTAASAYSLVFVAICFQCLDFLKNNKILRLTMQGAFVILAMATGLSRISRYYHHWSDVIGGVILGAVMAWIVAVKIMKLFAKTKNQAVYKSVPEEDDEDDKTSDKKPLVQ